MKQSRPADRISNSAKLASRRARLDEIVRQKDPALKEVVEQLARGNVGEAIGRLDTQGRVHEIPDRDERLKEIAREYAARPKGTLVLSPDNQSRREINEAIHRTMQRAAWWTHRNTNSGSLWQGKRSQVLTDVGPHNM